jgi:hypothetical protein
MDSLKIYLGPPCPTPLCPSGWPPLKWPNIRFRNGPPSGRATCSRLLPLWTPHAVCITRYAVSGELPTRPTRPGLGAPKAQGPPQGLRSPKLGLPMVRRLSGPKGLVPTNLGSLQGLRPQGLGAPKTWRPPRLGSPHGSGAPKLGSSQGSPT